MTASDCHRRSTVQIEAFSAFLLRFNSVGRQEIAPDISYHISSFPKYTTITARSGSFKSSTSAIKIKIAIYIDYFSSGKSNSSFFYLGQSLQQVLFICCHKFVCFYFASIDGYISTYITFSDYKLSQFELNSLPMMSKIKVEVEWMIKYVSFILNGISNQTASSPDAVVY
ncbi:unnamed protein product [Albugo candida]|uniref:Uncharacterized protein n=1 Tax=Albugo candida TaxID=65357 RepID=A0A024GND4_9STRA|nr:unnamed protein product [Albugo candida]|eukprot:CCI48244.1 unnamed protein product [Albugo candida]